MEQYTSEQALNGILNIIQTVVDQHQKKQESAAQNKTGDLITELLSGVAAASSKDVSIGTQVEALSNGMKAMKDAGVTDRDAKMVAGMITSIGQAIKTLEFSDVNNASVIKMAEALVLLGGIQGNIIDNINYLTTLNVRQIRAVGQLVADLSDFNGSVDDFVENINKLASINASAIDNINMSEYGLSAGIITKESNRCS